MVAFEGSGPDLDSLIGKHSFWSALMGNDRSLTGQSKAATVGLPSKKGSLNAKVEGARLDELL
jgi:hypothetical protein